MLSKVEDDREQTAKLNQVYTVVQTFNQRQQVSGPAFKPKL